MILLNLKLDGIYGFKDFEINFTYPKKVINSIIEDEYLEGRERFRYRKAVILMGSNATGKTSMGKALLKLIAFINTGNSAPLCEMVSEDKGYFLIDFVNNGYTMHRVCGIIDPVANTVDFEYQAATIDKTDSYEKCVGKLRDLTDAATQKTNSLSKLVEPIRYRFAYPEIESYLNMNGINKAVLTKTLKAVIGTLDPTLKDVSISNDLKDTFIIRRGRQEIIIQEGKLLNRDILSSGTAEGIDVAFFLSSMISKDKTFYYCDEHFSYIQSDIEKRIFGLMLDRIRANEQLIFTTHNTDMLDLNLPKHSFMFLRKEHDGEDYKVTALSASDILKRNTDSVRCAVENNVFGSLPEDSLLDELETGWGNE